LLQHTSLQRDAERHFRGRRNGEHIFAGPFSMGLGIDRQLTLSHHSVAVKTGVLDAACELGETVGFAPQLGEENGGTARQAHW
jgi:hypothetical protein